MVRSIVALLWKHWRAIRIPESILSTVDAHPLLTKQKQSHMADGNRGGPMGWQHVQVQTVLMERSASGSAMRVWESAGGYHSKYIKLCIHFTVWVLKMGMSIWAMGETSSLGRRCSGEMLELFRAWCSGSRGLSPSRWGQKVIGEFSAWRQRSWKKWEFSWLKIKQWKLKGNTDRYQLEVGAF